MTAGDTLLVPGNMKRAGLIIGSPKTSTIWLNFAGTAVVGQGIPIRPDTNPFILVGDILSAALVEEIRAVSDGAPELIGVLDLHH